MPIATGNRAFDSIVTQKLQHFKTTKKSGTNSYKIKYDTKAKGFEITSQVGQTATVFQQQRDSIISKNKEVSTESKQELKIRYRIPLWIWGAFLGGLGIVLMVKKH